VDKVDLELKLDNEEEVLIDEVLVELVDEEVLTLNEAEDRELEDDDVLALSDTEEAELREETLLSDEDETLELEVLAVL